MIKVGWCFAKNTMDLIGFEPEKLKGITGRSNFCPAITNQYKNAYVIKSPINLHLKFNKWEDGNPLIDLLPDSSVQDSHFENIVKIHNKEDFSNPKIPLIQLLLDFVFVTDTKKLHMESLPPFLEYRPDSYPVRYTSYQFDIYDWVRPAQVGLEWMDINKDIIIKRGDPIMYIRFNSKEEIKLIHIERTDRLTEEINRNISVKNLLKDHSVFVMKKAGLIRHKNWLS